MSKAFDTVDRKKLIEILKKRGVPEWDVTLIATLLTNTSLSIKRGKQISNVFKTNTGVPQGDGLSPKLFTLYLDEALRELDKFLDEREQNNDSEEKESNTKPCNFGHDYARQSLPNLPRHIEYADDVDFFCKDQESAQEIVQAAKDIFRKYDLHVNETKTEFTPFTKEADLTKVKKLGSFLDDVADINRRKQLATVAMMKYRKISGVGMLSVRKYTIVR